MATSAAQDLLDHYLAIGHPINIAAQMAKAELKEREAIAKKNQADSRSRQLARSIQQ